MERPNVARLMQAALNQSENKELVHRNSPEVIGKAVLETYAYQNIFITMRQFIPSFARP